MNVAPDFRRRRCDPRRERFLCVRAARSPDRRWIKPEPYQQVREQSQPRRRRRTQLVEPAWKV